VQLDRHLEEIKVNIHKLIDFDLKRLSRGAALCGAPVGGGSVDMLGTPAPAEALTLTLAVGVFVGAGVWMFRRWGGSPGVADGPSGTSPEVATEAQEERELVPH
jgi:hypothetical protein